MAPERFGLIIYEKGNDKWRTLLIKSNALAPIRPMVAYLVVTTLTLQVHSAERAKKGMLLMLKAELLRRRHTAQMEGEWKQRISYCLSSCASLWSLLKLLSAWQRRRKKRRHLNLYSLLSITKGLAFRIFEVDLFCWNSSPHGDQSADRRLLP
jgi:hypothetical protein